MKKKIVAMMAMISMVSALAVGCGSTRLQNEYITIKQYKGLEVLEAIPTEVTDEDVERQLESYRNMHSIFNEITDRPAQEGDTVKIDYKGFHEGEAFEGGEQEGFEIVIGSGGQIDGFQEGIIGYNPGDTFEVEVTFPDPYPQNPDLAGKPAVFEMTLHTISEKELPELDDALAEKASETATTLEEWREEIKAQQIEVAENGAKSALTDSVGIALQENIEIKKLPEDRLDELKKQLRERAEQTATSYQMEFKDFIEAIYQVDEAAFEELVNENAERMLSMEIAIDLIAEKEKLIPTEAEIAEKTEEYVEMYGFESAEIFIEQAGEDYVRGSLISERVIELLVENAKQIPEEEWAKRQEEQNAEEVEEEIADDATADDTTAEEESTDEPIEEDVSEEAATETEASEEAAEE